MRWLIGIATSLMLSFGAAMAAERWDLPMAYADSNYHTQNGKPVRRGRGCVHRR